MRTKKAAPEGPPYSFAEMNEQPHAAMPPAWRNGC